MQPGGIDKGMIAISWNGLPQYAARMIRAAMENIAVRCEVIGSKPEVPVEGMEEILGQPVHWVDGRQSVSWAELGLPVPAVFVQSGWSFPAFSSLGREAKKTGGKVIGLSDGNWRGDFRQRILGPLAFRLRHRGYFDAMIVPGKQGIRLMRYFGMAADRVRPGMYGADPALFSGGPPLAERPRTILYVGQFIHRKDVLGLTAGFLKFATTHPDWTLHLCGSGPLRDDIPVHDRIVVEDFVQPEQLVARYHRARFLILPSRTECWGLVVHEAALCGCGLLLSQAVGSGDDLASPHNSILFQPANENSLVQTLNQAAVMGERELGLMEHCSRKLAAEFGPQRFARELEALVKTLL